MDTKLRYGNHSNSKFKIPRRYNDGYDDEYDDSGYGDSRMRRFTSGKKRDATAV